jgi:hypothetical protein
MKPAGTPQLTALLLVLPATRHQLFTRLFDSHPGIGENSRV